MSEIVWASYFLRPPWVIAIPTETVYGLAAPINNPVGIEAIFKIKERPHFDPLIVHIHSLRQAKELVKTWNDSAQILTSHFWPGPLTVVLNKSDIVDSRITSGLDTVAIRMPRHPKALEILRSVNVPLAAPSANRFGHTSPTCVEHVRAEFGDLVPIIDGGHCDVGIESTIVQIHDSLIPNHMTLTLLRRGMIGANEITALAQKFNYEIQWNLSQGENSPGALKHHYMPDCPVVYLRRGFISDWDVLSAEERSKALAASIQGEEFQGQFLHQLSEFKNSEWSQGSYDLPNLGAVDFFKGFTVLSLPEDPVLAARDLYGNLRLAAGKNPNFIVFVEPRKDQRDWSPILDRLMRASIVHL